MALTVEVHAALHKATGTGTKEPESREELEAVESQLVTGRKHANP